MLVNTHATINVHQHKCVFLYDFFNMYNTYIENGDGRSKTDAILLEFLQLLLKAFKIMCFFSVMLYLFAPLQARRICDYA